MEAEDGPQNGIRVTNGALGYLDDMIGRVKNCEPCQRVQTFGIRQETMNVPEYYGKLFLTLFRRDSPVVRNVGVHLAR